MKNLTKKEMNLLYGGRLMDGKTKVSITTFFGYCSSTPGGQMVYSKYYAVEYSDGSVEYYNLLGGPAYSSN